MCVSYEFYANRYDGHSRSDHKAHSIHDGPDTSSINHSCLLAIVPGNLLQIGKRSQKVWILERAGFCELPPQGHNCLPLMSAKFGYIHLHRDVAQGM